MNHHDNNIRERYHHLRLARGVFSRGDRCGGCALFVGIITPNGAYLLDLFVPVPLSSRSVIIIGRPERGSLEKHMGENANPRCLVLEADVIFRSASLVASVERASGSFESRSRTKDDIIRCAAARSCPLQLLDANCPNPPEIIIRLRNQRRRRWDSCRPS